MKSVAALANVAELSEAELDELEKLQAFGRRYTALREAHSRKPSLVTRLDRAGLTAV